MKTDLINSDYKFLALNPEYEYDSYAKVEKMAHTKRYAINGSQLEVIYTF